MLHTKFRGNRPADSGEDSKGFYHMWACLGHGNSIMPSDFHFLVPESFHKNLVQIGKVVSEKIRFEFLFVHDLGPRSRNYLDLQ